MKIIYLIIRRKIFLVESNYIVLFLYAFYKNCLYYLEYIFQIKF
jgi:hypothetical protein